MSEKNFKATQLVTYPVGMTKDFKDYWQCYHSYGTNHPQLTRCMNVIHVAGWCCSHTCVCILSSTRVYMHVYA